MSTPTLSVVMSVYNGEDYLNEGVESILSQSFSDFEFIIIDDASTDNSFSLLQDFSKKDDRIKLFKKDKNIGLKGFVENLNIGLRNSKGKYIARMDQDDIAQKERFQLQIDFLENNPSIFLVGSSLDIINEDSVKVGYKKALTDFSAIQSRMNIDNAIFHPAIVFRNEPNLFYRDKFFACEDFDFHLRLITDNKIIENLEAPLLSYRVLSTSISRKGNSFIKRLFIEKAKEFYKERKQTGKDSYDAFDDQEFLRILEVGFKNSREYLEFGIKVAILYQNREELAIISAKLKKFYNVHKVSWKLNQNLWWNKIESKYLKKKYWQ